MLNIKVKDTIIKGIDLSNIVCEYEVNRLTNEKVIIGKRNFNANCLTPDARWMVSLIYKPTFSSKKSG